MRLPDELYEVPPTDTRYSSMKSRLKVRMLNSLFHLNLRRAGFSRAGQAFYAAHRGALVVSVLIFLGARRAAKHIAEKTLRIAEQFSLTDVAMDMAIRLRSNAGATARPGEFDHYDQLVKQFFRSYEEELLSMEYYNRIFMILWRHPGDFSKFAEQFEAYKIRIAWQVKGNKYLYIPALLLPDTYLCALFREPPCRSN